MIGERYSALGPVVRALLACAAASLIVWGMALALGMTERPAGLPEGAVFTTYFEAHNWWPFPLFFLLLIPVTRLTWRAFMLAWRDLARTQVLVGSEEQAPSAADLAALHAAIGRRRKWALLVAALAALAVNVADVAEPARVFLGRVPLEAQVDYACRKPDAWSKWVFEARDFRCPESSGETGTATITDAEDGRITPPASAVVFALLTLAQQVLIVFFVSLVMAQLLLHTALFGAFERLLPELRARGLRLRLNPTSPVNEFGLERWNYALNNFYWLSCPVLLLVFLSRSATEEAAYAPGQAMLAIVVPTLLLAPMIGTIIARQVRLPEVWSRLETGDEDLARAFPRQQLWPLDRNWSAKLGIILAFTLAAFSLGYEVQQLLGVAG